jgi:hypothetical protein
MGIGKILGGAPKGPSPEQLKAQQEAAARAERDKMAQDKAGTEASAAKQMDERQTQTRQLASGVIEEETGRKRFLKGI